MRKFSLFPGTFVFQTTLRPMDIEFILIDKLPEPSFLPDLKNSDPGYYAEADKECFLIRGTAQHNRLQKPIAEGRMEQLEEKVL